MGWLHRLRARITVCWPTMHDYAYDGDTLGGIWIRCKLCGHLEEFLPGVHEPKGGRAAWMAVVFSR